MIKLTKLLKENPDTIRYNGKNYNYNGNYNKSAFFVYTDAETNERTLFGYSAIKKEFFSSNPELLKKIEAANSGDFGAGDTKSYIMSRNNGGGHTHLEELLNDLNIRLSRLERGRIFEIEDDGKKVVICTFWEYKKSKVLEDLKFWIQAIEFNGYDPKDLLYELNKGFLTYEQFIDPSYVYKVDKVTLRDGSQAKEGDAVIVFNYSYHADDLQNPDGIIVDIIDDEKVMVKITRSTDSQYLWDRVYRVYVDSICKLSDRKSSGQVNKGVDIRDLINSKNDVYIEKKGKLHTTGATLTTVEKQNLQREVDTLELEIEKLEQFLNSGVDFLDDAKKKELQDYVALELKNREHKKPDYLYTQAAKQYPDMPFAKLRQKYGNIPLDKMIKKESLYRKLARILNIL